MRFKHLRLENFRSHLDTQLDLERITAVRGENAVGKSSIEDGLGFLLAGRALSTGINGQGAYRLIHSGADKAVVTAELADGMKMRASLTEKGGRSFQAKNGSLPEMPRDVWSCLCSTGFFFRLSPGEQRDLLATLVVPIDAEIPQEAIDAAKAVEILIEKMIAKDPLERVAAAYEMAFTERTSVNLLLRDWREPEKPSDEDADVEGIRQQIGERQGQLEEVRNRRRVTLESHGDLDRKIAAADLRVREVQEFLDSQRRDLENARVDILSDATVKKSEDIVATKAEREKLQQKLTEQIAAVTVAHAAYTKATEIETEDKKCPTCQQLVSDELLKTIYAPVIEAHTRALDARDATQAHLKTFSGDVRDAEYKLKVHRDAVKTVGRLESKIKELEEKHKQAQKVRSELGTPGEKPDTAAIDAEIADLEQRVQKGWQIHTNASMAAQRKIDHDKAWERRRELEVAKANLDRAVEVLGPKGARVQMLDKYLSAFAGRINALLQTWGYTIDVTLEPYTFKLEIGRRQIDLDLLSASQKLRFGIAFQVALAIHLGIGFVVIDQVDMLDVASRKALFNRLFNLEGLDQAILLVTDEKSEAPPAPGTVFYRLELDENKDTVVTELRRTPEEAAA